LDVQVTWSRVDAPATSEASTSTSTSETSTSTPQKKIVLRSQSPMALDALALYSSLGHAQGMGSQESLKARIVNGLGEDDAMDTIAAVPAPQNL